VINVADLIEDPDFAQEYTVYRNTVTSSGGRDTVVETTLDFYGVVIAANTQDIQAIPEADRVSGMMIFYSTADNPLYLTRNTSGSAGTSDQILWNGERYKLISVNLFSDWGYYKSVGVRTKGA